jgi:SAM-dependent methyltransferase
MTLELTGERTLPDIPRENYWFQRHVAAYELAARLARGVVLDAGAGEGYGSDILAEGARVVALELDPLTLAHAASTYPGIAYVRADLCRLPIAAESLDAIVALQVIEHLRYPETFLLGCRRALRPGGVFVLSTPNRETFPSGENPFHAREFDAGELRALLVDSFAQVLIAGVGHGRRLSLLDRTLGQSVQDVLVDVPYEELPKWFRSLLQRIRSRHFRLSAAEESLDLFAVCRKPPE